MVLEIAAGVCLGIVAAVLLLQYWRQVFKVSAALVGWILVIAALLWGASAVWSHRAAIASRSNAVHAFVVLALLAGIVAPLIAYKYAVRRYSGLRALLSREPPWDQPARAPARYVLILLIAIGAVAIGAAGLFGVARIGDWVIRTWS